jgi:diguanylate cyclase (GGDEF)-like protein
MRLTTTSRTGGGRHLTPTPRLSAAWASVVVIGALLVIFALDRTTGSAPLQHLYYLPIIFAGFRFGLRGGIATALAAVVSYHVANPGLLGFQYETSDVVEIALFIIVGVVTAKLTQNAYRLHQLATTDDLTGLHNIRSFESRFAAMVRASRETGAPLALLVLDVDRLKSMNDTHGHLAGAEAVRTVGHIIAACLPADAVACRYGGDEFVAAVPGCTEMRARGIADEVRCAVNETAPVLAGVPFPAGTLSVSVGLACCSIDPNAARASDDEAGEAMFRAADAALYLAKGSGRNHVCVA